MRKSFAVVPGIVAFLCLAACAPVHAADLTATPLAGDGELVKLHDLTEKIFQFKIEAGQLRIDRAVWDREGKEIASAEDAQAVATANNMPPGFVQNPRMAAMDKERRDRTIAMMGGPPPALHAIFRSLQERARKASRSFAGGGDLPSSSIHNGWKQWQSGFAGETLAGELRTNNGGEELQLQELQPPRRMLEFRSGNDASMLFQLTDRDGETMVLRQDGKGRFFLVIIAAETTIADEAKSFIALVKQHRRLIESEVLPVLARIGVRPILSSEAPEVRDVVWASLLRGPKARAEGERLLSDLDSDSFDVREAASQALSSRYALLGDLIREKLMDKSNSAEMQARLERIVAEHPDSPLPAQTVAALGLASDPLYLVTLLDAANPKETQVLVKRLQQITGEQLGSDTAGWKKWARSQE
jgi:hypothetical protein